MKTEDKVVTKLPLEELWDGSGMLRARRVRCLTREDIKALLSEEKSRFVIADVGLPLQWVIGMERFSAWKSELGGHLCENEVCYLDEFPGEHFYRASEWRLRQGDLVIAFEKYH